MKGAFTLIIFLFLTSITFASDTYEERLDIFQLPNNYFLNNFTYTFTYLKSKENQ